MDRDQLAKYLAIKVMVGKLSEQERAYILRVHEPRFLKKEEHATRAKRWKALLVPLNKEIASVNSSVYSYTRQFNASKSQYPPNTEDTAAIIANRAYYSLLVSMREAFMAAKKKGATVGDIKARYKKLQLPLPNNGEHWTDWVSDEDKARIVRLFGQIVPERNTKQRDPFPRKKYADPTTTSVSLKRKNKPGVVVSFGETSHPKGVRELADHLMDDSEFIPYKDTNNDE